MTRRFCPRGAQTRGSLAEQRNGRAPGRRRRCVTPESFPTNSRQRARRAASSGSGSDRHTACPSGTVDLLFGRPEHPGNRLPRARSHRDSSRNLSSGQFFLLTAAPGMQDDRRRCRRISAHREREDEGSVRRPSAARGTGRDGSRRSESADEGKGILADDLPHAGAARACGQRRVGPREHKGRGRADRSFRESSCSRRPCRENRPANIRAWRPRSRRTGDGQMPVCAGFPRRIDLSPGWARLQRAAAGRAVMKSPSAPA